MKQKSKYQHLPHRQRQKAPNSKTTMKFFAYLPVALLVAGVSASPVPVPKENAVQVSRIDCIKRRPSIADYAKGHQRC